MDEAKMINDLLDHCIANNKCCIIILKDNDDRDNSVQINSNMPEPDIFAALRSVVTNTVKAKKH